MGKVGGKDLLLKTAETITISVVILTDDEIITASAAHGLEVNDLFRASTATVGANGNLTADQVYYVASVPSTTTFTIAASPGGTALVFTEDITSEEAEVFKTVGGLRSKSFTFNAEGIDVTEHGSNQWREMLAGGGIKSVSVSGSGVYTSATNFRALETAAFANTHKDLAFVDVSNGRLYIGEFKITSIEASAEYNAEGAYSMSAESSGEVTVVQAA